MPTTCYADDVREESALIHGGFLAIASLEITINIVATVKP